MKRTIKVTDMKNLKEGDVVLLPKATVTRRDPFDAVRLEFDGGEEVWIQPNCIVGIEVTREVEPEFNITWPLAFDAMVKGKVCANDGAQGLLYRLNDGRFEFKSLYHGSAWYPLGHAPSDYNEFEWRIVEEAE